MKKFKYSNFFNFCMTMLFASTGCLILFACMSNIRQDRVKGINSITREHISINEDWRFFKYDSITDDLIYDVRPAVRGYRDDRPADSRPTEAMDVKITPRVLKPWILPAGNDFIKDPDKRYVRPEGNPGSDFQFVQTGFDDNSWKLVNLPHDWAIEAPFS